MILEWIAKVLLEMCETLATLSFAVIPRPPNWFLTGLGTLEQLIAWLHTIDAWVPVNLTLGIAGAVCLTYVMAIGIQIVRTVVSYFTLGGGAS